MWIGVNRERGNRIPDREAFGYACNRCRYGDTEERTTFMEILQNSTPIDRAEHEEFKRRMEDEHKRINHRLADLEETVRQIGELTTSVHSLAQSVEQLVKSQNRQESRLEELENRDGDTWRKVKWYLLTLAIGAVFGLLVAQIGL